MSTPKTTSAPDDGGPPSPPQVVLRYGKFLFVGFTGFFVNLAVFTLVLDAISPGPSLGFFASISHFLSETSPNVVDTLIASAVAFGVATLWNFTFNSVWTFRTHLKRRHSLGYRLALYFGVSLGSLAVNEAVLFFTVSLLPPLYGQGVGVLAGSVVGFVGNARITFAQAEAVESG